VSAQTGKELDSVHDTIDVHERHSTGFGVIGRTLVQKYPRRTLLGLGLFVGQAFLYNAVYFTQALVLARFFGISGTTVGGFLIPLAVGSLLGPLVLGRLFDTVGRRAMIAASYLGSGVLLVVTAVLFQQNLLSAWTLTIAWSLVFFLASAGSSAAYLTVSEIFPLEIRAMAIALFYSVGTGLGGIIGPVLFGGLVATGNVAMVAIGYYLGAAVMMGGGVIELLIGVEAAQKSLEDIASPLSSEEEQPEAA
jgi:MFS family permease